MNTLLIDLTEIKRLKLTINEYLTLLHTNNIIEYNWLDKDIDSLVEKEFLKKLSKQVILSEKAINYFESSELFNKFYHIFPHKVPGRFGEERPLRTESSNTSSALVTKGLFKKKIRGNKNLQEHIINVLSAEIDWRQNNNSLQYMNNIDTWLRQHNWEKYEYLLESNTINTKLL
jgi:hypothetical protein